MPRGIPNSGKKKSVRKMRTVRPETLIEEKIDAARDSLGELCSDRTQLPTPHPDQSASIATLTAENVLLRNVFGVMENEKIVGGDENSLLVDTPGGARRRIMTAGTVEQRNTINSLTAELKQAFESKFMWVCELHGPHNHANGRCDKCDPHSNQYAHSKRSRDFPNPWTRILSLTAERDGLKGEVDNLRAGSANPAPHHAFFRLCEYIGNDPKHSSKIRDYEEAAIKEIDRLRSLQSTNTDQAWQVSQQDARIKTLCDWVDVLKSDLVAAEQAVREREACKRCRGKGWYSIGSCEEDGLILWSSDKLYCDHSVPAAQSGEGKAGDTASNPKQA